MPIHAYESKQDFKARFQRSFKTCAFGLPTTHLPTMANEWLAKVFDGRIIQQGDHEKLISTDGRYKKL